MDINDLKKLSGLNEKWTDFLPGGTGRKARRDREEQKAAESQALLQGDGENWIAATDWYGDYNVIGKFANKAEALKVMDQEVRDMHDDTNGEMNGIVIPPEGGKMYSANGEIYDLDHNVIGKWRDGFYPQDKEEPEQQDMFDDISDLRKLSGLKEAWGDESDVRDCPKCKGKGDIDGKLCRKCDGDGVIDHGSMNENDLGRQEEPGTYVYSGLGSGTYHSVSGEQMWLSPQEANAMANDEGVEFRYVDSLNKRDMVNVMDSEEVSKMAHDAMDDDDEVAAMASPEDESNWEDMEEGYTPGLIPTPDYLCHQCTMMHTSYKSECDECGSWDIERIEVDDPRHSSKNDYFDEYRAHNESVNEAYSYLRTPVKKRADEGRCWDGYEPTPGKKAYSKGSCRKKTKEEVELDEKEAGMSDKERKAYNRKHGSNLKRAQPSGGKRRTSYCARSKGQQDMHNIDCRKTPDKKICKARRDWNC